MALFLVCGGVYVSRHHPFRSCMLSQCPACWVCVCEYLSYWYCSARLTALFADITTRFFFCFLFLVRDTTQAHHPSAASRATPRAHVCTVNTLLATTPCNRGSVASTSTLSAPTSRQTQPRSLLAIPTRPPPTRDSPTWKGKGNKRFYYFTLFGKKRAPCQKVSVLF